MAQTAFYRGLFAPGAQKSAQSPSRRAAPRSDDTLSHITFRITMIGAPRNSPQRPHNHPQNMIPTKMATWFIREVRLCNQVESRVATKDTTTNPIRPAFKASKMSGLPGCVSSAHDGYGDCPMHAAAFGAALVLRQE